MIGRFAKTSGLVLAPRKFHLIFLDFEGLRNWVSPRIVQVSLKIRQACNARFSAQLRQLHRVFCCLLAKVSE